MIGTTLLVVIISKLYTRIQCARAELLFLTVRCAEQASLRHWVDRDTLRDWVTRGNVHRCVHHLAISTDCPSQMPLLWRSLLEAGLCVEEGDDDIIVFWPSCGRLVGTEAPLWGWPLRRRHVTVHCYLPDEGTLRDMASGDIIPEWIVGVPKLQMQYTGSRSYVRVPQHEDRLMAWRREHQW